MHLLILLTGLINRRIFDEKISFEISRIKRYGSKSSLLIGGYRQFKDVNDIWPSCRGCTPGGICPYAEGTFKETDIVARIGGEEFAIL